MSVGNAFCPHCGVATQPDWVHCSACGKPIQGEASATGESSDKSRKRTGLLVGAGFAALLVVVGGLWLGSQVLNAHSYDAWLTEVASSENNLESYNADLDAAQAAWDKATNNGVNRTDAAYNKWREAVEDTSYDRVAALKVKQHELENMTFLPWQGALETARNDYLDHQSAWIAVMEDLTRLENEDDYQAAWKVLGPDIKATWEIVQKSAYAGLPTVFVGDLRERADEVFAD